jgi:hypothetical protein
LGQNWIGPIRKVNGQGDATWAWTVFGNQVWSRQTDSRNDKWLTSSTFMEHNHEPNAHLISAHKTIGF